MRNPAEVMDVIISVQDVLKANDRTKLESIVEHIGSITVISIMQICYPSLAIDYFVNVCDCIVRRREPIYPQSVLRHYFKQAPYRGPARAFFYEILSILEGKTPYWYNKLVEGNQQEILSSKSSWILFYFINISSLAYYKISFIGAETLQTEIRYYLYNRSTISGKNIDTHFIYLAAYNINNGYYSKHDEAKHLAQIVSPILPLDSNEQSAPRFVPARKYEILAKQPTTRVIPYYGLCLDRKCSPQFERCFHCDLFIPDPQYREYIAAAIKRLQEANELIARKHGNDTIRQQNLKDIQTFNAYLEKMDATKKHQKES